MAIDRTAYNALVDDDGTNLVGTPWTKDIVKTVLLDPIDAAIAASGGTTPSFDSISLGTTPATAGSIRLTNNTYIVQRNAANTADVVLLGLTNADLLGLGGTGIPVVPSGINEDLGIAAAMWRNGYFSGVVNAGGALVGAGTVASPSLSLPGGYGFFGGSGASRIGVGYGGVERMRFDASAADYGFALAATSTLMWNSGALSGATTCDTRLRRTVAGTLALDNGAGAGGVFLAGTAVGIGAVIAAAGDVRGTSTLSIKARNAANSADITLLSLATDRVVLGGASGNAQITIDPGTADVQWGKALVAVGPTTLITLGKTGGSGPATAAQNAWLRLLDSTGAACWIPVWK